MEAPKKSSLVKGFKITAITVTQGRLLPASLIYGDGTKFFNDRKLFDTVYNEVKRVLPIRTH